MLHALAKSVRVLTPRRRWAQFSLGTLFLVVTALCVVLGTWIVPTERQRQAAAALRAKGAVVMYDYELAAQRRGLDPASAAPPGPAWIRNWLGVDYLADVAMVGVRRRGMNRSFTDSEALRLSAFPRLMKLQLYTGSVGDRGLACLRSLPHLDELELVSSKGPPITDEGLRCCEALPRLRSLTVSSGNISDAGLKYLARLPALRTLHLYSPQITDAGLVFLKHLPKLQELYLGDCPITDAGVEHLLAMRKLEKLTLLNVRLSDAGLHRLAARPGFRRLNLRSGIALHEEFKRIDLGKFEKQLFGRSELARGCPD